MKIVKKGPIPGSLNEGWEFGGIAKKIRLKHDHQTLTYGFMQLVDMVQPGGATTTFTMTNFSPASMHFHNQKMHFYLFFNGCWAFPSFYRFLEKFMLNCTALCETSFTSTLLE